MIMSSSGQSLKISEHNKDQNGNDDGQTKSE